MYLLCCNTSNKESSGLTKYNSSILSSSKNSYRVRKETPIDLQVITDPFQKIIFEMNTKQHIPRLTFQAAEKEQLVFPCSDNHNIPAVSTSDTGRNIPHTNLQILWMIFSVRVPGWKLFKHQRQVIHETEMREKET